MKNFILAGMVFCFVSYTILMFAYIFLGLEAELFVDDMVGALNLASDIYILCLPVTAVSGLQLPSRKKVGIILIFLTGLFCATSPKLGVGACY